MARAQLCGPVICYPRREDTQGDGFLDLLKHLYAEDTYRHDRGVAETLDSILIPAAELLGRQRTEEDARPLVDLAEQMGVSPYRVRLAMSRAAARQGNRDDAARYASEYLTGTDASRLEQATLTRTLDGDLRSAALRSKFRQLVDLEREGKTDAVLRQELTGQLWQEDDIGALAEGYRSLAEVRPEDAESLYQYAGALTQLGELPEAQRVLARAAAVSPAEIGKRLQANMARFALLRVYHTQHPDDGQG
jgi:tetratricopeptide (TPR) repeat protein